MASDAVLVSATPILLWIRELASIRQDNLAVSKRLGEILPPSLRIRHTAVITCGKTMLHTCCGEHKIRPTLVLTCKWAVGVPRIAIHMLSARRQHEG